jgi:hypothetical protein
MQLSQVFVEKNSTAVAAWLTPLALSLLFGENENARPAALAKLAGPLGKILFSVNDHVGIRSPQGQVERHCANALDFVRMYGH